MLGMPNDVSLWFCKLYLLHLFLLLPCFLKDNSRLTFLLGHLSGAKYLIDNSGVDSQHIERQFSRLLGWVEYHMVISRFTIRHWYVTEDSTKGIKTSVPADQGTCQLQRVRSNVLCLQLH